MNGNIVENNPSIGVVIIGVNVEKYIADCIRSVQSADYHQDLITIVYVDGGSTDKSVAIAKDFEKVTVIELKDRHPTPGRGRNAGWQSLSTPFIQFLDADTTMDPQWLSQAIPCFKENIAAVHGNRKEKYPEKNIYHIIANMEWNIKSGKKGWMARDGLTKSFGGDVLIKQSVLEELEGFDDLLVAGEDPDLSYRVRQSGYGIYSLNKVMTLHDLNMNTFGQYLKRAYRSGHAYMQICLRYICNKEKMFLRESLRIWIRVTAPLILIIAGLILKHPLWALILAAIIVFRPLFKTVKFQKDLKLSPSVAWIYTFHLSLVIYPQFLGMLRYVYTLISGKPLQNKGYIPKE